jgi:hypothetical protein
MLKFTEYKKDMNLKKTSALLKDYFLEKHIGSSDIRIEKISEEQYSILTDFTFHHFQKAVHTNISFFNTGEVSFVWVFDCVLNLSENVFELINRFHQHTPYLMAVIESNGYLTIRYASMSCKDANDILEQYELMTNLLKEHHTSALLINLFNLDNRQSPRVN